MRAANLWLCRLSVGVCVIVSVSSQFITVEVSERYFFVFYDIYVYIPMRLRYSGIRFFFFSFLFFSSSYQRRDGCICANILNLKFIIRKMRERIKEKKHKYNLNWMKYRAKRALNKWAMKANEKKLNININQIM